jgi:hypothetical protein
VIEGERSRRIDPARVADPADDCGTGELRPSKSAEGDHSPGSRLWNPSVGKSVVYGGGMPADRGSYVSLGQWAVFGAVFAVTRPAAECRHSHASHEH